MLTHTSGLRDWGNVASLAGWPRGTRVHTHAQVLDIVSRQRSLNFPSGTRYSYCNTGYNLAAIIVSRVSGQPFTEFTRSRIFEPLGMTRTSWRDDFTRIVKDRSLAYAESKAGFSLEMPFENVFGQGGLLTTVGDLLRWAANSSQPKVGDAAFVREMEEPGRFNDGRAHGYGFGLMIGTYQGLRAVSHSGATAAYRAYLSTYPDRQLSVAVLCNVATANATQYAHAVADAYLGTPAQGTTASTNGSPRIAPADGLAGLYRRAGTGEPLSIVRDGDALRVEPGPRLTASAGTRFAAPNGSRYEFSSAALRVTDVYGTVDTYFLLQGDDVKTRPFSDYAGTYGSDEAETTLVAAVDGGALVLKRRPDGVIRLTPVYADAFRSSLGFVRFERSIGGQVNGLNVTQDRVWQMRFERR
jgi:CubicO group peptidase (beta-lactamase class C family)